jgi:hypothetical protein
MTLDEFLAEARQNIVDFEVYWRKEHAEKPDDFPLELSDDNDGTWWEMLNGFDAEDGD